MTFIFLFSLIFRSVARIILRRERLFFRAPFASREAKQSFDCPAWDQSSRLRFVRVLPQGLVVGFLFRSCIKNSTDAQKHNDFFAIVKSIFVDDFSNRRLNHYDIHCWHGSCSLFCVTC